MRSLMRFLRARGGVEGKLGIWEAGKRVVERVKKRVVERVEEWSVDESARKSQEQFKLLENTY